jgi:alkylation response protein AidB-like acyl-CoA dehydrogenase
MHTNASEIPSAEKLISEANELIPYLEEMGPQHELNKRLSDEVMARLRATGFFRICQSIENGGYGMRPSVLWRVVREVAQGDSAVAWILSLAGLHPWMAGMFPVAAQNEVFPGGRDAVVIALTGNVGRGVTVTVDRDHYVLGGKWSYASGIDVADWAATLVETPDDAGGKDLRLMLIPQRSFRVDHGSWNVLGMRGTGSKDVYLDAERVPFYRTVKWSDVQRNQVPGTERNHGPMFRIPHTSLFVMSVAAAIAAVATGFLRISVATVRKRVPAGLNTSQVEDRFSLAEIGRAASRIDSAFNQMLHDVDEMWDCAVGGKDFTQEQRARYRSNGSIICDTALAACNDLARCVGGSLLPPGPAERYFRDVHSMAAHFLMQVQPAAELYGRALLGVPLPPNARI